MPARPWFAFYPSDYLGDTGHLTIEEHGAYLLLLFHLWNSGGYLTYDRREFQQLWGVTPQKTTKIWAKISPFFDQNSSEKPGQFYSRRMLKEMGKAIERQGKAAKAARGRWDASSNAWSNAPAMPTTSTTTEEKKRSPPPPDPDLDPSSQSRGGGEVDSPEAGSSTAPCPQRKIIDLYHQVCPHFPRVRKAAICEAATRARWREVVTGEDRDNGIREARAPELALAWFENFFIRVDRSDFMHGRQSGGHGHPPRWLNLMWLMNRTNFYKVLEGRYDG